MQLPCLSDITINLIPPPETGHLYEYVFTLVKFPKNLKLDEISKFKEAKSKNLNASKILYKGEKEASFISILGKTRVPSPKLKI